MVAEDCSSKSKVLCITVKATRAWSYYSLHASEQILSACLIGGVHSDCTGQQKLSVRTLFTRLRSKAFTRAPLHDTMAATLFGLLVLHQARVALTSGLPDQLRTPCDCLLLHQLFRWGSPFVRITSLHPLV